MTSTLDDDVTHILMTKGRVCGHNATGEDQVFQRLQRDLVFVGVAGNDTLMNDRFGLLIDDVQRVNGTIQSVPGASQRLAVQRDQSQTGCRCRLRQDHRDPARPPTRSRQSLTAASADRSPWEASAKTPAQEESPGAASTATDRPALPEGQGRHRPGSSERIAHTTAVRVAANNRA